MLDLTHDDVQSTDKIKEIKMKQGVFIFNENEIREEFLETRVQGGSYNTRELELPEGAGITSMLKCFAISGGRKAVKQNRLTAGPAAARIISDPYEISFDSVLSLAPRRLSVNSENLIPSAFAARICPSS